MSTCKQTIRACCSPKYSEKSFTVKWTHICLMSFTSTILRVRFISKEGFVLVLCNYPGYLVTQARLGSDYLEHTWNQLRTRTRVICTIYKGGMDPPPPSLKRLLECNLDPQVAQNQNRIRFFEKHQFQFRPFFRVYGLCSTCSSSSLVGLLQVSSSLLHVHKLTHVANVDDYTIFFQGMLFTSLVLFLIVTMSFTTLMLVLFLIMLLFLIMNLTFLFWCLAMAVVVVVVFMIMMFFMITLLLVLLLIVMLFMIALLLLFFLIMMFFVIILF